ncbi:MAG TPA: hypothetical protein VFX76_16010, partial [Roseiflexaceae bacterium]|nr:hypothetical protein [Roseiflexaceae bacterium]
LGDAAMVGARVVPAVANPVVDYSMHIIRQAFSGVSSSSPDADRLGQALMRGDMQEAATASHALAQTDPHYAVGLRRASEQATQGYQGEFE